MSSTLSGQTNIESVNIEGIMAAMMKALEKLAPHPDRLDEKGPLFVNVDSEHKPAAEYDGMLGSMVLEGFLGTAFAEVAPAQFGGCTQTFSASVDPSSAIDLASEYIQERSSEEHYNLGQKKAISSQFNKRALWQHMMDAYLSDLPTRLGLEAWISEHQRKLYALRKNAPRLAA